MITYRMLKAKGACYTQVELFKKTFPEGAKLSVELAVSVASKFDFDWAARNLLSEASRAAYEEAVAPLWAAYEEAVAPLWAAYKEAKAPLWAAYEEAKAKLFAELYIKENTCTA